MSPARDDRRESFTSLLFDKLQFLMLNYMLCSYGEIWLELKKYRSQVERFLQGFEVLPESVLRVLGVQQLRLTAVKVFQLDRDWNPQAAK